jgi:hypothetical protein
MSIDVHPRRRPPTSTEIVAEQKRQAAQDKARAPQSPVTTAVAVKSNGGAVAIPDTRTFEQRYIDEIAPANIVGRMIKFSKDGAFVTADDDEPVDEKAEFIALCDETLVGWIRFHVGEDTPPDRVQGLLYDGFVMPARDTLGDADETRWQSGLSGAPEDPWKPSSLFGAPTHRDARAAHLCHDFADRPPCHRKFASAL